MRFKAVIFDLDDTLYNEFDFVRGGYKAVANYLSKEYGYDCESIYHDMLDYYKNNGRNKLFDYIVERYKVKDSDIINRLLNIYRMHNPTIRLYEDAVSVIDKLKSIKIGLITDGLKLVQQKKVVALGLDKIMDNIIFTDELGAQNSKPSIVPFKAMCEALDLRPDDCCYVADNPFKDFFGPNKLNITTIRLNRGLYKDIVFENQQHNPKFVVSSLEEFFLI